MNSAQNNFSIILFDGICNFCNASVNRIIKNDKNNRFKFAALQSEKGVALQKNYTIDYTKIDSIILIEGDNVFYKSTAILKIVRHLGGAYSLLYGFIILPPFIRDFFYDIIAKNRYKWFGKKEVCMIPSPKLKEKFIF